jgi:hypothetical protein|tara:strand:- start:213 stop:449 length:237 start_codon:yes stop_codon:yes gene_type:complete
MQHPTLDELPDILTIHEVADFMRISPAVAYEMARRYRATRGREGLPVFMAGARMISCTCPSAEVTILSDSSGDRDLRF